MPPARAQAPTSLAERRAEELIRGVEILIGKLADPGLDTPLHLIDRLERALQAGHRSNMLRIGVIEDRALHSLELEK